MRKIFPRRLDFSRADARISGEIEAVTKAAEGTKQSTAEVSGSAEELRALAASLLELLGRFRT